MFATPCSILAFFTVVYLPSLVRSECECGYVVDNTLYTDLLESDFLHADSVTGDWQAQEYTVTPDVSRGPYGKHASPNNVVSNPTKNKDDWSGEGTKGGDAGVQLIVRGGIPDDKLIPSAELVTIREDLYYGSYRTNMKLTGTNGTCAAFFWYRNDTQEIDMEFLSSQYNDTSSPVNLVLQSPESARDGFDASGTGTFDLQQLPFAPDDGFHEYRFDWAPDSVSFYADGQLIETMKTAIPTEAGHITLSHWSNGNPLWSGGPPEDDAITTVEYFKGYFNSSDPKRQGDWEKRCTAAKKPNATCVVPAFTAAPDGNKSAKTYFFIQDPGTTPNQTVNGLTDKNSLGTSLFGTDVRWWVPWLFTMVLTSLCL